MKRMLQALDNRLRLSPLIQVLRRTRPATYISPWESPLVSPGRIALLLIVILFSSGLLLTLFYVPTAEEAAASVANLRENLPLGWLVHNIHRWSALLLLLFAIMHALRVWLTLAFRYPRDLNWLIGLLLFFLVVVLGGTGYLLRWDIKAFALMDLVISNLSGVPIVGTLLVTLVLGSSTPDLVPLNRGYALHIWFLPTTLLLIAGSHLFIVWRQGLAHRATFWMRVSRKMPATHWINLVPGFGLLLLLLVLSLITPNVDAANPDATSHWPAPDWLLMFYFLPFWFFKGQSRIIGTLLIPLILAAILVMAPRFLTQLQRTNLLLSLLALGAIAVILLLGQMTAMGSTVPMPGCQACHQEGLIGGAPAKLSDFDIRDPDWLVFHLRTPRDSLLIPFSDVP